MRNDAQYVVGKLAWMREHQIWPNGLRYLWTDAFGVILLVSLYDALNQQSYLDQAESIVAKVDRVLGRPRGIRIGEALALDVGDLDRRDRILMVRKGKFGKSRVLPLQQSVAEALACYVDHPLRPVCRCLGGLPGFRQRAGGKTGEGVQ